METPSQQLKYMDHILHPYNCKHDWRTHKTAEGVITCDKCGQMEKIEQELLTPTGKQEITPNEKQESGCEHCFVFSHKSQEEGINQTIHYCICIKCGILKINLL